MKVWWQDIGEALNAAVRPLIAGALCVALCYGFVVSKVVSVEAFIGVVGMVFGHFFRAREDEKREKATADAVKAAAVETAAAIKADR